MLLRSSHEVCKISAIFCYKKRQKSGPIHMLRIRNALFFYGCCTFYLFVTTFICSYWCFSAKSICDFFHFLHNLQNFPRSWITEIASIHVWVVKMQPCPSIPSTSVFTAKLDRRHLPPRSLLETSRMTWCVANLANIIPLDTWWLYPVFTKIKTCIILTL